MSLPKTEIDGRPIYNYFQGKPTYKDKNGYLRLITTNEPVHRLVAEIIYNETWNYRMYPFSAYTVHHKNKIRTDNRPENLELLLPHEHQAYHPKHFHMGKWDTEEY